MGSENITDFLLGREDPRAHSALERLVDFLHSDRSSAISSFLGHPGSEDLLAALVRMLLSNNVRVSGNAAYVLGILSETEGGFQRVYHLANRAEKNDKGKVRDSSLDVLANLVAMLVSEDTESVMNVAGTLGSLAETQTGRKWMLESPCIDTLIDRINSLLLSDNTWTAGNSALVLARLSISEDGCVRLVQHKSYKSILENLINSLGITGRATNAAFAIGRLCDQKMGQNALENHNGLDKMVNKLYRMLSSDDIRWSKNACFAVSCLANKKWSQDKLLSSFYSAEILTTLAKLLFSEDHETGWFSAVALHTLATIPRGCLQIRKNASVEAAMKRAFEANPNAELKMEVTSALEFLKRLPKPESPKVHSVSTSGITVKWDQVLSKCGFPIMYKVYKDEQCVFEGKDCFEFTIGSLQSATEYCIQLQTCAEEDNSPLSDATRAITMQEVPGPPLNLQVVGRTVNLLKISWDPPQSANGTIKLYHVLAEVQEETAHQFQSTTTETSFIMSGLRSGITYKIQVLATNSQGKGHPASIQARTADPGSHVPPKPNVTVIGRCELHVTWSPPAEPLGRINHYDLSVDGIIVYSGNKMNFYVRRLTPDTEYSIMVSTVTSEGRFDSKPVKKKTAKDEYETNNTKSVSTAETPTVVETPKCRPKTSLPRRCKSACAPLKSGKSSPKEKIINEATKTTWKSPTADNHSMKRPTVHSAMQRHDGYKRKMSARSSKSCCIVNCTSNDGKTSRKPLLTFPSYVNISLRSSKWRDRVNAAKTQRHGHLVRTKTFLFSQLDQAKNPTNEDEAEDSCGDTFTRIQNDHTLKKATDTQSNTVDSKKVSASHPTCRMWSVPSAFRNKSAVIKQQKQHNALMTSRFSNFIHSCRESQIRSVFNSHRWLAMQSRPCLELRVPVSTPETANTNSSSSRKSSTYSDASSSVEKKQVCFEDTSKIHGEQNTSKVEHSVDSTISPEALLQSLRTLELHERANQKQMLSTQNESDSFSSNQTSPKDDEPQNISYSENSSDTTEVKNPWKIIHGYSKVCKDSSQINGAKTANFDKIHEYKGSADSAKSFSIETNKLEKQADHVVRNGHFVTRTLNILPFQENNHEESEKTTKSSRKKARPRTVCSVRTQKINRSSSSLRRPGTVSVSRTEYHQSTGINRISGKDDTDANNSQSQVNTRFLGIRTMTFTPTTNLNGLRNNNSVLTEGFLPSQLRTQPCNLNFRQLQRLHTTLLGLRGENDKLVLQTLLYQRNQPQQQNTPKVNKSLKSSKRLTQESPNVRGSSYSYMNGLITGISTFPPQHRSIEPDSILLRQSWT